MAGSCPECTKVLPATAEPPRFCPYCGSRLLQSTEPPPLQTTHAYQPSPEDPEPVDTTPKQIGNYRIIRLIASGGMGRVYEAQPLDGGPNVAVKVVSTRLQANPTSLERFRQEGRLAAQIAHPHCVFVIAADADRGRPYIVMELMPGDTLKDLVDRRGPLPSGEAIRLILDVIDGLAEAHRLGVIHRDVKPSNCFLVENGRVKVGDFGLSKSLGSAAQLTQSGAFLGTVLYASPEQIKGEPVDFASDVYSVCATLFHLLTGRAPFQHDSATAALAKIISEAPPGIRTLNAAVPNDLARVIHRGLERDRGRRYTSLGELRADLSALVPEQLTFGGMGVRIGAYLIDAMLIRLFVVLPLDILAQLFVPWPWLPKVLPLLVLPLYFVVTEGLFGRSIGKRLLRLRVCRTDSTLPPGFKRAILRTSVFYLLIIVTMAQFGTSLERLSEGRFGRACLHLIPFAIGFLLLIVPMRRSNNFRGLHELASATRVLRLRQAPRPLRLRDRTGSEASKAAVWGPPSADFPGMLGPYRVERVRPVGTGWVAFGVDSLLNRRAVIRVVLGSEISRSAHPSALRPVRLWRLGTGTAAVRGAIYAWEAFVAPSGMPIRDVTDRHHPVPWPEVRPILDLLAEELRQADQEGSTPPVLTLDQLWLLPDGRPQLIDFPISDAERVTPVGLIRSAAAVLLEGAERAADDRGPIRAPLPRHAASIIDELMRADLDLDQFRARSAPFRELPQRLTVFGRAVQLAVQSAMLGIGLTVMFTLSGLYSIVTAIGDDHYMEQARKVRRGEVLFDRLSTNLDRSEWERDPELAARIRDPGYAERMMDLLQKDQQRLQNALPGVTAVETLIIRAFAIAEIEGDDRPLADKVREFEQLDRSEIQSVDRPWATYCLEILSWPLIWAGFAFAFRGGLSHLFTGIIVVRRSGGVAYRRQCAVRALAVWLPIALLLCVSVILQSLTPQHDDVIAVFWWGALLLLPICLVIALLDPERGPHDRLVGTWLVPR